MTEPPDRELEAQLRQGPGREWLEEAAEDEQLTELLRRRRLDLGERIREMVHRGDRVRAEIGPHTFTGLVGYAGGDFATVDRGEDQVEVVAAAATWTVEPSDAPGHQQSGEPLSFRARLAEIASTGEQVRVILDDGRQIVGSIAVVAVDHVEITQDQVALVIPIRKLIAVIRSTSRF